MDASEIDGLKNENTVSAILAANPARTILSFSYVRLINPFPYY
jgi:hypothetical protein